MKINRKIHEIRRLKKMSVAEFAAKIGVTVQAVYDWESGRRNPTRNSLSDIAECLNLSDDWLLEDKKTDAPQEETPKENEENYWRAEVEIWKSQAEYWRKIAFEKLGILEKFRVYPSVQV